MYEDAEGTRHHSDAPQEGYISTEYMEHDYEAAFNP